MTKHTLLSAATALLIAGFAAVGIALSAAGMLPAHPNGDTLPASEAARNGQGQERRTVTQGRTAEDDAKAHRQTSRNLRTIGLAMQNFAAKTPDGRFPAAAILAPAEISKESKPFLSWRVAILPFLNQQELYDKFHRDEPWDSPHNKALLEQIPEMYEPVIGKGDPQGFTYYQVFTGDEAMFAGDVGPRFEEILDQRSQTAMVTEANKAVPWTKPEDVRVDKNQPLPKLGGQFQLIFRRWRRQFPAIFRGWLTRGVGARSLGPSLFPPEASLSRHAGWCVVCEPGPWNQSSPTRSLVSSPRWLARGVEARSLGPDHTG